MKAVRITDQVGAGPGHPLLVLAGPCVVEERDFMLRIAETVRDIARAMAESGSAAYGRTGSCLGRFGTLVAFLIDALNAVTGNLDQPGGEQRGLGVHLGTRSGLARAMQVDPGHRVDRLRCRPVRAVRHVVAVLGHGVSRAGCSRPSPLQRATGPHDPHDSPDRPTPHRGARPR